MLVCVFSCISIVFGQFEERTLTNSGDAQLKPESYFSKPLHLIDLPTASILRGGDMRTGLRLYEQGGMMGQLSVGISNRIMFGVSYGGLHFIGGEKIIWNKVPGVHFAYRLIEESLNLPALVIGFDSQGYGPYRQEEQNGIEAGEMNDRYSIKSRGFYGVVSKGYKSMLKAGLHAGVNFSLEDSDGDRDPNIFTGLDLMLSRDFGIHCEYDFAINDDVARGVNNGKGYLNAGFRWAFSGDLFIEFDFKNVLAERVEGAGLHRTLKVVYHGGIL